MRFLREKQSKLSTLKSKITNCFNYKKQILIIISLWIGALLLGSNITLWMKVRAPIEETPVALQRTIEYQLKLNPEVWRNKTKAMMDFYGYLEEVSGIRLPLNKFELDGRIQNNIVITNCTREDTSIRLRTYVFGPKTNSTTLDAKKNVDLDVKYGEFFPIDPSAKHFENAVQKIEKDVHPCHYKYSRETRITDMPKGFLFYTCKEISQFFPGITQGVSEEVLQRRVGYTSNESWLLYSYSGYLDSLLDDQSSNKFFVISDKSKQDQNNQQNNQKEEELPIKEKFQLYKFKTEITLLYNNTLDWSRSEIPPEKGEFSLRIWSTYDGHGPFDPILVRESQEWYSLLLHRFGSENDLPCPFFSFL